MRCLRRNKVRFYYALYEGKTPVTDDYGNATGEYEVQYGKPVEGYANISAAVGENATRQFGDKESYDKVLVTEASPMDEQTILWIDTVPQMDVDGSLSRDGDGKMLTPYDYIVQKVAQSLNSVSYAIRKVEVS